MYALPTMPASGRVQEACAGGLRVRIAHACPARCFVPVFLGQIKELDGAGYNAAVMLAAARWGTSWAEAAFPEAASAVLSLSCCPERLPAVCWACGRCDEEGEYVRWALSTLKSKRSTSIAFPQVVPRACASSRSRAC
jgi:hypothetical protein